MLSKLAKTVLVPPGYLGQPSATWWIFFFEAYALVFPTLSRFRFLGAWVAPGRVDTKSLRFAIARFYDAPLRFPSNPPLRIPLDLIATNTNPTTAKGSRHRYSVSYPH